MSANIPNYFAIPLQTGNVTIDFDDYVGTDVDVVQWLLMNYKRYSINQLSLLLDVTSSKPLTHDDIMMQFLLKLGLSGFLQQLSTSTDAMTQKFIDGLV